MKRPNGCICNAVFFKAHGCGCVTGRLSMIVEPVTRVEKRENEIKLAFWTRFGDLYPITRYFVMGHQEVRKSGYPDNSVNGRRLTTWWEFKHATPNFTTNTLQELTCRRLEVHSHCRYVLFYEHHEVLKILIAKPSEVFGKNGKLQDITIDVEFQGHDFDTLAAFIDNTHKSLRHDLLRSHVEHHSQHDNAW